MTLPQKIYTKLKREATYRLRDFSCSLGFYKSFYTAARGSRILVYHGVCKEDHLRFNTLFLTEETFEQHLQFYKTHFNVISLDDYYRGNFSAEKFNVCLTFDDGFANNHKYVLPLLKKYKLPAAFFVTTIRATGQDILWNDFLSIAGKYGPGKITFKSEAYIKDKYNKYRSAASGKGLIDVLRSKGFSEKDELMKELYPLNQFKTNKEDEDYWLQMTTEQIKEVAASPYTTIGSHGYYHNDLSQIDSHDAFEELALSKQYLENVIEKPVSSIAFPYGAYNNKILEAAKRAGYTQLLATEFNDAADNKNSFIRERFTVNPFISVNNQMHAIVKSHYE